MKDEPPVSRPEGHLIVVFNGSAGAGVLPENVFDAFEEVSVQDVSRETLRLDDEVPTTIAVWGGDGTCRAVASLIVGTSATLLACPGGTHNHYAKAAGLASVDDVVAAVLSSETQMVSIGMAESEVFLNNASFGWYVDLVIRRERYEEKMPRKLAKFLSVGVQLWRTRRMRVVIDGTEERVWMVWVGNGQYSLEPTALTEREELDEAMLDVRILRAGTRLPKVGAFLALVGGNAESSRHLDRRLVQTCTLAFRSALVQAALDGELVTLANPVHVQCSQTALRLRVPPAVETLSIGAKTP